jgi:hypothetical protein
MPVRDFVRGSVKNVLLTPRWSRTTHVMRLRAIGPDRLVSEPAEKPQQGAGGGAQEDGESG